MIISLAVLSLMIAACSDNDKIEQMVDNEITKNTKDTKLVLKQNVALIDARIRSVSSEQYVREMVFSVFGSASRVDLQASIIFDSTTFFDDGSYNDLTANDGIYTSAAVFSHNSKVPYDEDYELRTIMTSSVVDSDFQYMQELEDYLNEEYTRPGNDNISNGPGGSVTVECDIEFGTCGCYADQWGWCDCCCFSLSNCTASATISGELW